MSNKIRGRNVFVQIKIDGVFYPVFCAKTAVFQSNQEELECTHVNSGADREFVPGMGDATVDVTGITTSDNSNGRVSVIYLLQAAQRRQVFEMRLYMMDENANTLAITFSAFSTSRTISREIASFSQSAASFRITGPINIDTTIDPPTPPVCEVQDPLYLTLAESATSVADALLEQDDVVILHVERNGMGLTETTGAPGNAEFKFTGGAGNGTIAIDPTNPGMPGGETIYVLYKIES